ncbi:MAG: hypothetical protein VBE63_17545 [Lamprobacter sp.]|uniref:hypothetical protein n=1 Tax=Lamprobacter sp. TaxID=3100796 RepID=UPI002B2572DA|nr:hypothetical protein [Lamprobacter sp.]MEA3641722.1 hypothetical protein [Lamprobacter sp.]
MAREYGAIHRDPSTGRRMRYYRDGKHSPWKSEEIEEPDVPLPISLSLIIFCVSFLVNMDILGSWLDLMVPRLKVYYEHLNHFTELILYPATSLYCFLNISFAAIYFAAILLIGCSFAISMILPSRIREWFANIIVYSAAICFYYFIILYLSPPFLYIGAGVFVAALDPLFSVF